MKQTPYSPDRNDDTLECFTHFRMHNRICREFCAVRLRCLIERNLRVQPGFFDEDLFSSDAFALRTQ
ncbi:hypothetical protein [Desulfobotulus sp.]|jgi:hypothetical protein|uniref:hypothetical protein n=1 Tax=Desulfobotulus sp. TaxID=1940337 RepID=UPI002A35BE31|nr:hypothetical protein [Desulfobotulus sp.]MDY0162675.1 hypothetical protein [Desulfobotulus sp.]